MAANELTHDIFRIFNDWRAQHDLAELDLLHPDGFGHYFFTSIQLFLCNGEYIEDSNDAVLASFNSILENSNTDDYHILISSTPTHLGVSLEFKDEKTFMIIKLFNKYIELDTLGPFIDGNLVLQASYLMSHIGVAACKVQYAADHEESLRDITTLMPWDMLLNPTTDEENGSFVLPIILPEDCQEGTIHIVVYVGNIQNIALENTGDHAKPDFDSLIPTIDFTTHTIHNTHLQQHQQGGGEGMDDFQVGQLVGGDSVSWDKDRPRGTTVSSLKVSNLDRDNSAVTSQGYQCILMSINSEQGAVCDEGDADMDLAAQWHFHLGCKYNVEGDDESGIEDVIFVSKDGPDSEVEDIPERYELDSTNILQASESGKQVFLAWKKGPLPRYQRIMLVRCDEETQEQAEACITSYVDSHGGGEVRMAPTEVSQWQAFRVGLVLLYGDENIVHNRSTGASRNNKVEEPMDNDLEGGGEEARPERNDELFGGVSGDVDDALENDNMSRITGDGQEDDLSDEDDEAGEDMFVMQEAQISSLQKQLADLEAEKGKAIHANADLVKKCSSILARIGRDSQSRGGDANDVADQNVQSSENSSEKESLLSDTLKSIWEGRNKLLRQQAEYDELALELQTKLDDKEFKAEEIAESLIDFKREILSKAENSRTAKGISKRLIKHYEYSEKNKDTELEKVRLRNISLKTTLRKLEKILRSREQLAEGLHMIDFEQLKIENQTLSEKIEERNEELAKLKRKKTVTVQILTHIREKLKHVETQNSFARNELCDIDARIIAERGDLTSYKHERDVMRDTNSELKRQRGFATSSNLIVDYEKRKTTIELLTSEIKELQERHFLLTQQISNNNTAIKRSTGGLESSRGATSGLPKGKIR